MTNNTQPKLNELKLQMKHTNEALDRMETSNNLAHDKIESLIKEIRTEMKSDYVSYKEFLPVQKLIYSLVGVVLTSIVVAVLGLVIL